MKNALRLVLVLALASLMGGCMEMSEEIWINADGSGRIKLDVGLAEGMVAMATKNGGGKGFCTDQEKGSKDDPNIVSRDTREYSAAGMRHCVVDVQVKDFRKITDVQTLPMDSGKEEKYDTLFAIEDLGDGVARFRQRMASKEKPPAADAAGGDAMDAKKREQKEKMEQVANGMLAAALADKYLSVTLHAPSITSTKGGELNDEKSTVSWKIPLFELVANKGSLDAEAEVKYELSTWDKVKGYFR